MPTLPPLLRSRRALLIAAAALVALSRVVVLATPEARPFGPPARPSLEVAGEEPLAVAPNAPPPPAGRPPGGEPAVAIAELGDQGDPRQLRRPRPEPLPPPVDPPPDVYGPHELPPEEAPGDEPALPPPAVAPDTPPRLVHLDPPRYPSAARRARREATVRLQVAIDVRGRVISADPVGETMGLGFEEAAREAALRARFEPARRRGRPVPGQTSITVRFVLDR
jgi:protein TonB